MRYIIIVFCLFILFSCTKKNTLKTEKNEIIENNPVVVTFNENLDKKIKEDVLETDYYPQKIIEKRYYSNPLYEYWTLGGRFTTFTFYDQIFKCFREFRTFISLDGFHDAMIVGNGIGWRSDKDVDKRAEDSDIYFFYENNSYYSFGKFSVGYMDGGYGYSFEINDKGVIILTSDFATMYDRINDLEIQYKYKDDELVLFNITANGYRDDYIEWKDKKIEMIEFIYLKNKIILRDYKKNENIKDNKHDLIYINEDTEDLKKLYIAVLRRKYLSIIDYISNTKYIDDFENSQYNIVGLSGLYYLTKKEVEIFEDCLYEYLNNKKEDEDEVNKEFLFYVLKKMKKE